MSRSVSSCRLSVRVFSLMLAICCFWSFAGASIAMAATPEHSPAVKNVVLSHFPLAPHYLAPPPQVWGTQTGRQLGEREVYFSSSTLLDEVGHLAHPVALTEVAAWRKALARKPEASRAALLHLWLGEWQLGANEQPLTAQGHFHEARALLAHTDRLYGLASYDTAIAEFKGGAYADANADFVRLLTPKTALHGYDRKRCALWLRHAAVCAGYHATRAAVGIPEPTRLDPLCGAAALAASLQALGLPSDQKTVLAACRVTGEGSSLQDIYAAGPKLGVSVEAVTADDQGLMLLPKPLVAHVEHDHFISVIRADKHGVSYLCSDCGMWPGGRVDLTWAQWHLLEPDMYGVVSLPGSVWAGTLAALPTASGGSALPSVAGMPGVRVASAGHLPPMGRSLNKSLKIALHLSTLGKHIIRWNESNTLPECELRFDALKCADCLICCLLDTLGGGGNGPGGNGPGDFGPVGAGGGVSASTAVPDTQSHHTQSHPLPALHHIGSKPVLMASSDTNSHTDNPSILSSLISGDSGLRQSGPQHGDPVNLATGEEEYTPDTDLTVYNPNGPTVQWTRRYDSLRGESQLTYEADDYGIGWSQSYNVGVINPDDIGTTPDLLFSPGSTQTITADLTHPGGNTPSDYWTIYHNGVTYSNNSSYGSPGGWNITSAVVSGTRQYTITVPSTEYGGTNYQWAYTVQSPPPNPNPQPSPSVGQGTFDVVPTAPHSGTKSLFLENGGRVTFNAPSVPTSASPRVICSPQAGAPFLAEWDYDSSSTWGHFVITWKDRTKWVTTDADGRSQYVLHQIIDRNGNALTLNYSAPVTTTVTIPGGDSRTYPYDNFPLLSSITNSVGTTLLTVNRSSNGLGTITSVSDCYGRSVAYSAAVEGGGPSVTFKPSLTHVSQIIPTASLSSSSVPDRYAYGYSFYQDDQTNSEPMLHTITAPSPAGPAPSTASLSVGETGTSTASINYSDNGAGAVSSLVDGNGNTRTYTACTSNGTPTSSLTNYTKVTVTDKNGNVSYSYIGGVDMYMSAASVTDGSGHLRVSRTFSDPNDPYRPPSRSGLLRL